MKRDPYKDDQLLELVGDLCNFILDQIVYVKGTYHDQKSDRKASSRSLIIMCMEFDIGFTL